jgi:hypothetical protein
MTRVVWLFVGLYEIAERIIGPLVDKGLDLLERTLAVSEWTWDDDEAPD